MKEEFEKELQELSPFLAGLKKQQKPEPFKTPRLYFDTLADKVIEKASEAKTVGVVPPQYPSLSNRISGWLSTIFQPRMALAACGLALVVAAGWYVVRQQTPNSVVQNDPSVVGTEAPKNNGVETPINKANGVETKESNTKQPTVIGSNESKTQDTKTEIVDNQTVPKVLETAKPSGITHPKSGLTEEEIEEFLKEALDDEDIETIGGK
jgi:hypothetical protein